MRPLREQGLIRSCNAEHETQTMSDTAVAVSGENQERGLHSAPRFLLQVSRPGLWSTTALFYLMPLGHWTLFRSGAFWIGLFYVLFPLGLILYGVNDIADAQADRYNPRKGTFLFGSQGAAVQLASLRWQIAVVQLPFLIFFLVVIGPRILWWFALLLAAVGIYNAPRFGCKARPPFDVLIQASYLLVFVLSSWLNGVPQLPWQAFVFGALFAMHSHIFGEVMDIAPDRLVGRRTTATTIGAVNAKFLIAGILAVESMVVYAFFQTGLVAALLVCCGIWFVLDATMFWKNHAYQPGQMRMFMWAWNAASLAAIYWDWATSTLTQLRAL
jgi:4-hydroxybenzoate polyprenyltransferase